MSGNGIPSWMVEQLGPRQEFFEDDLVAEIDFKDFLRSLPPAQRRSVFKRAHGIPMTVADRDALRKAKPRLTKWLEIRTS